MEEKKMVLLYENTDTFLGVAKNIEYYVKDHFTTYKVVQDSSGTKIFVDEIEKQIVDNFYAQLRHLLLEVKEKNSLLYEKIARLFR